MLQRHYPSRDLQRTALPLAGLLAAVRIAPGIQVAPERVAVALRRCGGLR
jgi:hypothetical protein